MRRRLGWGKAINEELKEKGTLKEHGVIRKISIFLTVLPETNENHEPSSLSKPWAIVVSVLTSRIAHSNFGKLDGVVLISAMLSVFLKPAFIDGYTSLMSSEL